MYITTNSAWCDNKLCRKKSDYNVFNDEMPAEKIVCPHCGFKTLNPYGISPEMEDELRDNLNGMETFR